MFRKILKINPSYSRTYMALAVCWEKLGNTRDAVRYYKKYLKISNNCINNIEAEKMLKKLKSAPIKTNSLKLAYSSPL